MLAGDRHPKEKFASSELFQAVPFPNYSVDSLWIAIGNPVEGEVQGQCWPDPGTLSTITTQRSHHGLCLLLSYKNQYCMRLQAGGMFLSPGMGPAAGTHCSPFLLPHLLSPITPKMALPSCTKTVLGISKGERTGGIQRSGLELMFIPHSSMPLATVQADIAAKDTERYILSRY